MSTEPIDLTAVYYGNRNIARAAELAQEEAFHAIGKFKPFNSSHEGFAVLKEEVDELWEEIKRNNIEGARREAIQVAAMALRFIAEIPTRKEEP